MTELSNWIRLTCTNGIGCETARKLLLAFGLPHQIFSATLNDLKQVVTERQAQALCLPLSETTQNLIEQTERWCDQPNNHFITLADPNYPANLLEIPDPPTVLYVKGRLDLLSATSVAVVGSRNFITPAAEMEDVFFPQKEWIIDTIHERILPLAGHTPTTVQTAGEVLRRNRLGL